MLHGTSHSAEGKYNKTLMLRAVVMGCAGPLCPMIVGVSQIVPRGRAGDSSKKEREANQAERNGSWSNVCRARRLLPYWIAAAESWGLLQSDAAYIRAAGE
jgi:hypothetical protein